MSGMADWLVGIGWCNLRRGEMGSGDEKRDILKEVLRGVRVELVLLWGYIMKMTRCHESDYVCLSSNSTQSDGQGLSDF